MPWGDSTTALKVVALDPDSGLPSTTDSAVHDAVAGAGGGVSVMQPSWSPKTGELFFVRLVVGEYCILLRLPMTFCYS